MRGIVTTYNNESTDPDVIYSLNKVLDLDAAAGISGSTWLDQSNHKNNGTLVNSPIYSSENGGVLLLNGTNQHVDISTEFNKSLQSNSSFTISMFVNIDEPTKLINGGLFNTQRYQSENDPGGFGMSIFSTGVVCLNLTKVINGVGTSYEPVAPMSISREIFAHYLYTYDANTFTVKSYKNGVLQVNSTNSNYAWSKNNNRVPRLGLNTQGGWTNYYKLKIGTCDILNRALTQSEITALFNKDKGRFGL